MAGVRSERIGLLMVGASLAAILVVIGLLFHDQREARRTQIREQGTSLVRVLAKVPYPELVGSGGTGYLLPLLENGGDRDRAYIAVADPEGRPVLQAAAPGVIVPSVSLPPAPSWLLHEANLLVPGSGRAVREYCAPVFAQGQLAGFVRAGYFDPGFAPEAQQVPFFATLALPVFLLVPFFYFLLRREIRPIGELNQQLRERLDSGALQTIQIDAAGELREFVERFNDYARRSEDRLQELQLNEKRMLTSTKVLSYHKARTESALRALPDAAIVLDETGAVTFANSKVRLLLGAEPNEIQGKKPHEWCGDEALLAFLAQFNGGPSRPRFAEPVDFAPAFSPERRVSVNGYPLFSPRDASAVLGTLVVCRDITSEGMARRSGAEFVAHVSHELKSPLNVIGMYAEQLLGEDGASKAFRVEAVNVIQDEVDRLSALVNNLLNITKIEMGNISVVRQRVKLGELLGDVLENVGRSGRAAGCKLQLDLPPELSPVSLDKDLFRVALNNLLSNAIKYSRPGGAVRLSAEEDPEEIRIAVQDQGLGIAPEDLERIFEKFYRSPDEDVRKRTGHGLGLSLTREIVELHHGRIEVRSRPGEGSEFTIRLRKDAGLVQQSI